MKRYRFGILLLLIAAVFSGCGYRTPEACHEAVFKAVSNDDVDAFFACVLTPPEDPKEREAVFTWIRQDYNPYIGGSVISKNEVDGVMILNVSPSEEFLNMYGTAFAPPPLALAFVKEKGYKLDLEYTQKIKQLNEMYRGLMR